MSRSEVNINLENVSGMLGVARAIFKLMNDHKMDFNEAWEFLSNCNNNTKAILPSMSKERIEKTIKTWQAK